MDKKVEIVVIKVLDRIKEYGRLQNTLSDFAKNIKTRFGFHELNDYKCSRNGLIILELTGEENETKELIKQLKKLGGIITEVMTFNN